MSNSFELAGEKHSLSALYLVRTQDGFQDASTRHGELNLFRNSAQSNTFHFTLNAVGSPDTYGAHKGESVIVAPLKDVFSNGQVPSGFGVADTWINAASDRSMKVPGATVIAPADARVPLGVDVVRYERGSNQADTIAARDKAVAAFFESKGAVLHKVGSDQWAGASVSRTEYRDLLKAVVGEEAADKVFLGRHANSYDAQLKDLLTNKSGLEAAASKGARHWLADSGAQMPISARLEQLDQQIGDSLMNAIKDAPSENAKGFYTAIQAQHGGGAKLGNDAAAAASSYRQGRAGAEPARAAAPAAAMQIAPVAVPARGMRR